jgi:hypothetical protein
VSTYVPVKTILNTFLTNLRAWDGETAEDDGEPLASCVFRKGPQYALNLGSAECACVVALRELIGGEQSAGSGNNFWHSWSFAVVLAVPDDETAPETTEDLRLDLIDEFLAFMADIDTRTMFGGAKWGVVSGCTLGMGKVFAADDTIYRYADITVEYRSLRSRSN